MESIIHPLVLVNISDHLTRELCRSANVYQKSCSIPGDVGVVGALLGSLEGSQLSIVNSFEIALLTQSSVPSSSTVSSNLFIGLPDWDFFQQRLSQYHEIFPQLELVGWYIGTCCSDAVPTLLQIVEESNQYCDSPCILIIKNPLSNEGGNRCLEGGNRCLEGGNRCLEELNKQKGEDGDTKSSSTIKNTPPISVQLFEKISNLSSNVTASLKEVQYKLESGEAERIGLSHVMSKAVRSSAALLDRTLSVGGTVSIQSRSAAETINTSSIAGHLDSWYDAADELVAKIDAAVRFLERENKDHTGASSKFNILNELSGICHAIEREKNSIVNTQDDDEELSESLMLQSVLVDCSNLTASTVNNLKRIVELKSNIINIASKSTPDNHCPQIRPATSPPHRNTRWSESEYRVPRTGVFGFPDDSEDTI